MKCYQCGEKLTKKEMTIKNLCWGKYDVAYVVIRDEILCRDIKYSGAQADMAWCFNCAKKSYLSHTQRLGGSE